MSEHPAPSEDIRTIIERAQSDVDRIPAAPFSPQAFAILKLKIGEYISDLVSESIKTSKRHVSDTVSGAHVERASEYLISSSSRRVFRHIGLVGGILLGAALSNLLAMTLAAQYSGLSTLTSAGLGIVGAFLVALHVAKD